MYLLQRLVDKILLFHFCDIKTITVCRWALLRIENDSSKSRKIMEYDTILLSVLIPTIIVLLTMCLLSCLRCGRRNHQPGSNSLPAATSSIYTVPTNYSSVNSLSVPASVHSAPPASSTRKFGHNRISSHGDRFMVPLDLLPPNFDYSAPGVEHKGDYVLIKDLKLIQMPDRDEYQKQSPYNPNYQ